VTAFYFGYISASPEVVCSEKHAFLQGFRAQKGNQGSGLGYWAIKNLRCVRKGPDPIKHPASTTGEGVAEKRGAGRGGAGMYITHPFFIPKSSHTKGRGVPEKWAWVS